MNRITGFFGGGKKTSAFAAAMAAAEEKDEDNGDADQIKASLDKYRKKLKKASVEDAAKYEARIAKYDIGTLPSEGVSVGDDASPDRAGVVRRHRNVVGARRVARGGPPCRRPRGAASS